MYGDRYIAAGEATATGVGLLALTVSSGESDSVVIVGGHDLACFFIRHNNIYKIAV